ncbi:hypothetical protein J2S00_003847 [Caldalkalibacillus uzonensis]|uniref:Uncharacterized protein n=1 Tax=Caldalkalibacillus uzonensis TaxID=353224 RepID=A0ABU0CXX6_9BACI|nr:hypothetical protein [Caldalkalibacillus uzonensis]MDQ0341003.1 hypothetical protein [Caldalkalibacillus uzonensis]
MEERTVDSRKEGRSRVIDISEPNHLPIKGGDKAPYLCLPLSILSTGCMVNLLLDKMVTIVSHPSSSPFTKMVKRRLNDGKGNFTSHKGIVGRNEIASQDSLEKRMGGLETRIESLEKRMDESV